MELTKSRYPKVTAIIRRESLTDWYLPPPNDQISKSSGPLGIVEKAYRQAVDFHQSRFSPKEKNTWLSQKSSIQDVMRVLAESHDRSEAKKEKRRKQAAKLGSWWKTLSSRMLQYEKVVDTFVSSHAEYTAIIWGAMKFLFIATRNHEELSAKIAQAFAEIATVLPEAEFVSNKLYPTERMQATLAQVYVQIIEFCIRATKWYDKAHRSSVKKVLSAVLKPWPLEFQDIQHNINYHFQRLREQSAIAHQAETRRIHLEISGIRTILEQASPVQLNVAAEPVFPLHANPSVAKLLPFIPERVARYLVNIPFNPTSALELATTMRDRRRARGNFLPSSIWTSQELRDWISSTDSALLQLPGLRLRAEQSRDIASELIQLLRSAGVPVVWYLGSNSPSVRRLSVIDILRSLVQQIVDQCVGETQTWHLNEADFAASRTEKDWLQLFVSVGAQVERITIVIDAHQDISDNVLDTAREFWDLMKEQKISTVVKVLVLTYGTSGQGTLNGFPALPSAVSSSFDTTRGGLRSSPRAGLGSISPRSLRSYRALSARLGRSRVSSMGVESLKPLVAQCMGVGKTQVIHVEDTTAA
ncbi:hypothetical protein QBC35DRAFT_504382 [Podospora australis]|uniref:DUF7708 domain-containing protein n=1 Tax=Podospora australis TaxID=1536484 RepID=A0AAN7AFB4_9PEZI|nr:hypothetical protein QBC35DRAFT_504382 [Podospora australis]